MPDKTLLSGSPLTRKKYTPAIKAECVRQVAAGAWQTDVARAQGLSPTLLGRWQPQALAEAFPNSAERDESRRLRAELKRLEQERDVLKKLLSTPALSAGSPSHLSYEPLPIYRAACGYRAGADALPRATR